MTAAGIIVVNWNSGALLSRCLRAIRLQTTPPLRTLVVDNASTDGSVELARDELPGAEYIRSAENIGFARANNLAAERCGDCDWICLLNPDAFPEPGWLEALAKTADAAPEYAAFASLVLKDAGDRIDSAGDMLLPSGIALHRLHDSPAPEMTQLKPCEVFAPCAAAAMYRHEAFRAVGGFDDELFAFYEDVDLGMRLRLAGHRALFVPDAVVRHVGGGTTGGQDNPYAFYYGQRNLVLTYVKNMPGRLLWSGLPAHAVAVLRGIGKGIRQGLGLPAVRATFAALVRVPACLAKRRCIQRTRRISVRAFAAAMSA